MTINLINKAGRVFGSITLAPELRLIDLERLRALGAVRVEVLQ